MRGEETEEGRPERRDYYLSSTQSASGALSVHHRVGIVPFVRHERRGDTPRSVATPSRVTSCFCTTTRNSKSATANSGNTH